jgi:hypothetical protein
VCVCVCVYIYIYYFFLIIHLTFILLLWRTGRPPNSIPIYIQQDATLDGLFISGNCSTCFGWYFHPSSGAHTTVSTASGICHAVTGICRYRGRVGTGLSVLWVAYATHSTLKPVPTLPRKRQSAVTVWQIPDAVDWTTGVATPKGLALDVDQWPASHQLPSASWTAQFQVIGFCGKSWGYIL